MTHLHRRWHAAGGYREFLHIAFPLILSTASWSINHFVDRVFLTWYSTAALAASYPAGMTNFVVVSLFMGIAQYINTFVAQYSGANRFDRIGPAVWQGLYLAIAGLFAGLALSQLATPLFNFIGHELTIRNHEITYFRVLCYGIAPLTLSTAASCFFSGQGKTLTVLAVNLVVMGFNIVLDYGLIFGAWGLPDWGIRGAAWATNLAALLGAVLFLALMLKRRYRASHNTVGGWRPNRDLLHRMLRYGGPSGINFMLDILAFALFILIVGRIGPKELAASNMAFNINSLAFMPLIGGGIAVSTMVGQRLGSHDVTAAEYVTWTAFYLAAAYTGSMALAYLLAPDFFLTPFAVGTQSPDYAAVQSLARELLRLVAVYCIFDAAYMMFTAALKGAGDTRYVMWVSLVLSFSIMVLPPYVITEYYSGGIFTVWAFMCAYVIILSLVFYLRFRTGRWKEMRVIESPDAPQPFKR